MKEIRDIFSLWQRDLCPGGQVLVRKDGEIIFEECFGYADLERKIPVTPDTIFHVASVSKQITTMSILLLRERGMLDIEADVREYLPDLIAFKEPVTVRDMMNNISGIRDQWVLQMLSGVRMNDVITQADLLYLNERQREINFPPRSKYLYSNTNFVFLSEIVGRVSGKGLPQFARENIFEPLGMSKTFIRENYDDLVENRALSYVDMGDGTFKWKPLNFSNNGATSLHTTARDFMKWLKNFEDPVICTRETLEIMTQTPTLTGGEKSSYACGLQTDERCGHKSIGHGGADAGYRSHVLHFPKERLDIVVLSNTENIPMGAAAFKIAGIVLGAQFSPEKPCEHYSDEKTAPITGGFCVPEMPMSAGIYEKEGQFFLRLGKKHLPLVHEKGNRYRVSYLAERLYFKQGEAYFDMLGTSYKMQPQSEAEFSPQMLASLGGTYYSDEIEAVYSIDVKEGKAFLRHKRFGSAQIKCAGEGKYLASIEKDMFFSLVLGEDGGVRALRVFDGRVLAFDLNKVKIEKIGG